MHAFAIHCTSNLFHCKWHHIQWIHQPQPFSVFPLIHCRSNYSNLQKQHAHSTVSIQHHWTKVHWLQTNTGLTTASDHNTTAHKACQNTICTPTQASTWRITSITHLLQHSGNNPCSSRRIAQPIKHIGPNLLAQPIPHCFPQRSTRNSVATHQRTSCNLRTQCQLDQPIPSR